MRKAAGRVVFFDALAEGLLRLHPGPPPKNIALLVRDSDISLDSDDRVALAEALCRLCANDASSHIHVRRLDELGDIGSLGLLVVEACGRTTSEVLKALAGARGSECVVVVVGYSGNASPGLVELPFDIESDRELIDTAVRTLFKEVRVNYDPLAAARFKRGGFPELSLSFDLFEERPTVDWEDPRTVEKFCHEVSRSWRYGDQIVDGDRVYKWVEQFGDAGFVREACQLLVYLKREGFVTRRAVVEDLRRLYHDHMDHLDDAHRVVSVQPLGKSEQFLAYSLRPYAEFIPLEKALSEVNRAASTMNLVCFDDVIVSGSSIRGYLFDSTVNEMAPRLIKAFQKGTARLTILATYADERGISAIRDDPRGHAAIEIKAATVIDDSRRVFGDESVVFSDPSRIQEFKVFCEAVGQKTNAGNPFGWKNAQWCVVLDYTVPNGTLPILWASAKRSSWQPLFPRLRMPPRRAKRSTS